MTRQHMFGVVLVLVGVVLLIVGMNASHALVDQVHSTFTGRFTQATTWYLLGGAVTGLLGLYLLFAGWFGKRA